MPDGRSGGDAPTETEDMTTTNVKTYTGEALHMTLMLALMLAAIAAIMFPDLAQAANGPEFGGNKDVLNKSCNFLQTVKKFFFAALYILGAIGLGVIAVKAYMGQFSFKSLFALGEIGRAHV